MKSEAIPRFREELESELKDNILSWWMTYAPDRELGGFHGHISHQNQVVKGAGKGAVLNARILWTFSAAYRMYKNPEYLFFDEATNALDAENERVIMNNLTEIFKGKTAVVVAHRLSTVKDADQIIVLDKGEIVETGTHDDLIKAKGHYFNLVKNQLELGS